METVTSVKNEKTNWYTLRVANGKENKIKESITRLDNYEKFVSQVLIPQEKIIKLKDGKKTILNKNLLPGYILVEFKTTNVDPDLIKEIETIKYCSGFLKSSDRKIIPLRRSELESIIGKIEDTNESVKLPVEGEIVIVIDGPFKGFKGTISKIDPIKNLVEVLVKVFGRDNIVSLQISQIDKEI